MKLKNVLKGLLKQYSLEEINIICLTENKVIYSGTIGGWKVTDVDMILYKKQVESMDVKQRIIYREKVFLFV